MKKILETLPFLQSSANSEKLSLTVKGIIGGALFFASLTGVIPADAVKSSGDIANILVSGAQGALIGISSLATAWGGLRKIYLKWFQ